MQSRLLAIGDRKTSSGIPATIIEEEKGYRLHYELFEPIEFGEPAFARLLFVQGATRPCFVTANFVALQDVQGRAEPVLGLSNLSPGPWLPLATGRIPRFGTLHVHPVDDSSIKVKTKKHLFLLIQVASASYVESYGGGNRAQSASRGRIETANPEHDVSRGEQ